MADTYWLPNVKDAEAPTLAEIQSGKRLNGSIMEGPSGLEWGNDIVKLPRSYRLCTPIKFPTTPETVCFMTGLAR